MQPALYLGRSVSIPLFFDIDGSMDRQIKVTEQVSSAAKTGFKHMVRGLTHRPRVALGAAP